MFGPGASTRLIFLGDFFFSHAVFISSMFIISVFYTPSWLPCKEIYRIFWTPKRTLIQMNKNYFLSIIDYDSYNLISVCAILVAGLT